MWIDAEFITCLKPYLKIHLVQRGVVVTLVIDELQTITYGAFSHTPSSKPVIVTVDLVRAEVVEVALTVDHLLLGEVKTRGEYKPVIMSHVISTVVTEDKEP